MQQDPGCSEATLTKPIHSLTHNVPYPSFQIIVYYYVRTYCDHRQLRM